MVVVIENNVRLLFLLKRMLIYSVILLTYFKSAFLYLNYKPNFLILMKDPCHNHPVKLVRYINNTIEWKNCLFIIYQDESISSAIKRGCIAILWNRFSEFMLKPDSL